MVTDKAYKRRNALQGVPEKIPSTVVQQFLKALGCSSYQLGYYAKMRALPSLSHIDLDHIDHGRNKKSFVAVRASSDEPVDLESFLKGHDLGVHLQSVEYLPMFSRFDADYKFPDGTTLTLRLYTGDADAKRA